MPKTKILHVISSLKIGGAEQVLFNILESLKNDFEHEVLYFHDGPFREKINSLNIKTTKISGLICNYDPIFIYKFIKAILNFKPDLISSSLWAANLFSRITGKLLNIPVINTIHALPEFEGKFRNTIDQISLNLATQIIAVSNNINIKILDRNYNIKHKIITIKNGVNIDDLENKFKAYGLTKKKLHLEDKFVIGTVGRFIKAKNQDLLIQAFKDINIKHPNTRLLILGTGPEAQNLKNLINNLNLQDKVSLIISQPAYKYLPVFDCFILPSKLEGLPIALLEALAAKLPVITTGINISKNSNLSDQKNLNYLEIINTHEVIINKYNGLLIEPDSIEEIISSIETVIKNPDLKENLVINSKKTLKQEFSCDIMAQKYKSIFIELLGN